MSHSLSTMTDAEVRHCPPAGEDAGFGALATLRGHLPLQALDVQAHIDGLLSEMTVRQTFVNTHAEPLEATYIFPLPDRAAVTRFRMEVAGRVVEGQLQERGAARQHYAEALRAGHRAAITEEDRPGLFNLRVGNLLPGEAATICLTLVGPLPFCEGEATFRFPLVVAPRYIPGVPLAGPPVGNGVATDTDAVPDASRITPPVLLPGYPNPVRLSLTVTVHPGGLTVGDFRSSLHAVQAGEDGQRLRRITLQPGERLDRDFILRFRVGTDSVQTSLALRPDAEGEEGTFLLTLLPPLATSQALPRPRDVVFVLDRSGSMAGWKMVAARRALARMVDTLTDRDRFTVLAFDDRIEAPPGFGSLVAATDRYRFQAVEFLARIDSRGGTEMAQPLDQAVTQLAGDDARDRILVLVTDGQVGNEDQLLRTLGDRLQHIRVFTLGIDRSVNEGFLKRLAQLGGGSCELVESEDRLDAVMDQVHRRISTPIVSDITLQSAGLHFDAASVVPGRLPDLFAGAPSFILGRYRGRAQGAIVVTGREAAGGVLSQTIAGRLSNSQAVPCVWARGRIRELEDRFVIDTSNQRELERQIVDTSLRFGVLCRFTAFVAVDRKAIVNEGGQQHKVTQAVEQPAGWQAAEAAKGAPLARLRGIEKQDAAMAYTLAGPPPAAAAPPPCPRPASAMNRAELRRGMAKDTNAGPADSEAASQATFGCSDAVPSENCTRSGASQYSLADVLKMKEPAGGGGPTPPLPARDEGLRLSVPGGVVGAPHRSGSEPGSFLHGFLFILIAPFLALFMGLVGVVALVRWGVGWLYRRITGRPEKQESDTTDRQQSFWK